MSGGVEQGMPSRLTIVFHTGPLTTLDIVLVSILGFSVGSLLAVFYTDHIVSIFSKLFE
jgi:hypothetical protein